MSFYSEIKSVFHHFKRPFSCQKLSYTQEWAFKCMLSTQTLYLYLCLCVYTKSSPWQRLSLDINISTKYVRELIVS